jgi:DNA-binding NarL/FixJ family response regulator
VLPTVLIVDDHADFRAGVRRMLEAERFSVVGEAAGVSEALAEAERLSPEIVLLDVHLPDGTGFDVAERLAATNGRSPSVILMSAHEAADLAAALRTTPARAFISKASLSGAAIRAVLAD